MNLSTNYLGLTLKNPLVVSASPLTRDLENLKRMEKAGAAAVVLYSLFEEQIENEARRLFYYTTAGEESFAEALSYFPATDTYVREPDDYVELIRKAKAALSIPVIASLNGISRGGWTDYATAMEQAGADAIELNVYMLPTNPDLTGAEIEGVYLDILAAVKSKVKIPVAMKLHPFFSSLPNFAKKLDRCDADGLVLFNRFYQPDINLETLEVEPKITLSSPGSMLLSVRWISILYGRVQASLAVTGGVHTAEDALKCLLAGADAVQVCATLLRNGIGEITKIVEGIDQWMTEKEYESLAQMKGSMSHASTAEPAAFERANYIKALNSYKG